MTTTVSGLLCWRDFHPLEWQLASLHWSGRARAPPASNAVAETLKTAVAVVGIDIGKNPFHIVGLDERGAIALRQMIAWPVESRFANVPPCLISMEACVGARASCESPA
jgi:hypothetical protein